MRVSRSFLVMSALLSVSTMVPSAALAQDPPPPRPTGDHRFELTPFAGFRNGGSIQVNDSQLFPGATRDVDVELGGAFGLRFDLAISAVTGLQVEVLADVSEAEFEDNEGLFGEQPGGSTRPGDETILDVEINYYHGGVLYEFRDGDYRPYVVATAGITRLDPNLLDADTVPSVSFGGGLKMWLSEHVGLRFEGRAFYSLTDDGVSRTEPIENRDCTGECIRTTRYDSSLLQTELTLGLALGF